MDHSAAAGPSNEKAASFLLRCRNERSLNGPVNSRLHCSILRLLARRRCAGSAQAAGCSDRLLSLPSHNGVEQGGGEETRAKQNAVTRWAALGKTPQVCLWRVYKVESSPPSHLCIRRGQQNTYVPTTCLPSCIPSRLPSCL